MVMLKTNWDITLDATYNSLSTTDSDDVLDVTPSDGALGAACAGVSICVANTFLAYKLLITKFIFTCKIQTCVRHFIHLFTS